jgi:hypothetical protein
MDATKLNKIVKQHRLWVVDHTQGSRAYLSKADLRGAKGIYAFGPIGNEGRIGYAVKHENVIMFALGCHWGNLADTCKAIVKKYGKGNLYEKQVMLAAKMLEAQD